MDVSRYPASDPLFNVAKLIEHRSVETVLDVGANVGDFALALRRFGYANEIVSIEPIPDAYRKLQERALRDRDWHTIQAAAGPEETEIDLNVAGNSFASSSVLDMTDAHVHAAPDSAYIDQIRVPMRTLDAIIDEMGFSKRRTFLKVDVQGFEEAVLDGCKSLLANGCLLGIQLELSLTPLYANAQDWQAMIVRLQSEGFEPVDMIPGFRHQGSGELLQFDAVMMRNV